MFNFKRLVDKNLSLRFCLSLDTPEKLYWADNVAITAGSGTSIATDDIGGVQFQRIKLIHGADGVNAGDVSTANGLPVALVAGAASIGILGANSGVDIGDVTINNASGGSAVNIQDGGNSITIDGSLTTLTTLTNITNWGNIVDNAAFADGTTRILMNGYVLDETAGTPLTENDGAAARIDEKRAQVFIQEDGTVRGRRAIVDYQGRITSATVGDGITVSGNILLSPLRQPVNISGNAQVVISGMANRRIRIINGAIMSSLPMTVQFKSNNNTDASGPLPVGQTGGFIIPHSDLGNFETRIGENLTLTSSNLVGGWLTYVLV